MRKIDKAILAGIFFYVLILFMIGAIYLLESGDKDITQKLAESDDDLSDDDLGINITIPSPSTTNQSTNINQTGNVTSNQTTPDFEFPFVGDLKALSITHKPEVLHKGEKGTFTLRFSWDGKSNSDYFTIGLYVDDVLVNSVRGYMDAGWSDSIPLSWTANDTGEKNISMRLDIDNEIAERNETNNNAAFNLFIERDN